jgi:hypothetical protein
MTSGKIVKKFFSKADAEKAATYQPAQARKEGRIILKVGVVNAYELYQANGWFKANPFKSLGIPTVDQYMVFVYYNQNVVPVKKKSALKKKIMAAAKSNAAARMFKIIKLTELQLSGAKGIRFVHTSSATVPAFRFRYRTNRSVEQVAFTSSVMALPTYSYAQAA